MVRLGLIVIAHRMVDRPGPAPPALSGVWELRLQLLLEQALRRLARLHRARLCLRGAHSLRIGPDRY